MPASIVHVAAPTLITLCGRRVVPSETVMVVMPSFARHVTFGALCPHCRLELAMDDRGGLPTITHADHLSRI
jgi:hypothetical protein